jgi:hypothetical protein
MEKRERPKGEKMTSFPDYILKGYCMFIGCPTSLPKEVGYSNAYAC